MTKESMDRLSDILAEKSIRAVAEDAAPIQEAWDLAFGEAVPDRDAVHYAEFRWHLFSYEKLPARSGDEARKALNEKQSQRLHLFWQEGDDAWELRNAFDLDDAAVDAMAEAAGRDLYVFDAEGCWTYVITHEAACGPYYFQW